jgi:hypothetical protein
MAILYCDAWRAAGTAGGPAVMTDDGPSAKRRRLPGLEDALAKRALCEGAGPLPWLVRDMLTGETLEFDGRSGYHLAQARQVAGLYFDPDRPLVVVAAEGRRARSS